MRQPADSDPIPGIRAVLLTGFLSSNAAGLSYLLLTGHLLEFLSMAPLLLLAGAFLGLGLVGMMVGSLFGLSSRLFLGDGESKSWLGPVVVAGIASASVGLSISYFIVVALASS